MGVKLREKQLSSGQVSFYLDIYHYTRCDLLSKCIFDLLINT